MSEPGKIQGGFRTLSELEALASGRLPAAVWDYIQGGSGEERTLRANIEAFRRRALRPRAFAGISEISLRTTLLGLDVRAPFFVAPMAYQAHVDAEGERATVAAAADASILAVVSTLSSFSLEEVARAGGSGPRWFQLYLQPEFSQSERLVRRAELAGYQAIVVTADVPLFAIRDRQLREGFALETPVSLGNGPDFVPPARSAVREGSIYRVRADGASGWEVVDRLRGVTRLPIVVKGVLRAEDARSAVEHGASAIVVSNHGGRQLDAASATLDVLPEIVREVGKEVEVYVDGGIRRASDIVIALSLGARAVGIGRPVLWALAVGGEEGIRRYFELLETELVNTMVQVGCSATSSLGPSVVRE